MFKFGKATPPTNDVRKTPFFCEASTCDDHSAENCFRKHGARCQLCHGCHYKNVRCQAFIIISISLRCLLGLQVGFTIRWSELSLQHMWADRGRKPLRPPLPTSTQVQVPLPDLCSFSLLLLASIAKVSLFSHSKALTLMPDGSDRYWTICRLTSSALSVLTLKN